MLALCPITLQDAFIYVARVHRHHKPPQGGLFAIGLESDGEVCGVAIVGRPVARRLQDGYTCEVTRLATDGSRNACSMLYRACWRAARAMGYRRLMTYTLKSESGASLKASGFKLLGETPGKSWSVKSRPRVDKHPLQERLIWELTEASSCP